MSKSSFVQKYSYLIKPAIAVIISAIAYAFSMSAFISGSKLLTGGASGIALIIARVFFAGNESIAFSVLYVAINLPLFYLAFRSLGKVFSIFSVINVILASILIALVPPHYFDFINLGEDMLTTALFAGIFTGFSTGIALRFDTSAGGVDILGAYISEKRGVKIGNYIFLINGAILLVGGLLFKEWVAMLYTIVYFYVSTVVVNAVHKRNNKKLIKIITNLKEEISSMLVKNSKHGCTIVSGEGAFTKQARYVIETVVSENEVKPLLRLIYETDPQAFTTISNVDMVKGKFQMPPIR